MNFWKKIFSWKAVGLAVFFLVLSQNLGLEEVFAQSASAADNFKYSGFDGSDTLKNLAEVLGMILHVLVFIALWMMSFFGKFLGTEMITGDHAYAAMQDIWVWFRNLTNVGFVFMLVALAFTNLYSSFSKDGGGNWDIKTKLPRIIIALIAVNFSLLGFKVVIDAVNVGTVAILGVADSRLDIDNSYQQDVMINAKTWIKIKKDAYTNLKEKIEDYDGEVQEGKSCTKAHNKTFLNNTDSSKTILGYTDNTNYYICRNFRSQVNDLFCPGWSEYGEEIDPANLKDNCLFVIKEKGLSTMLKPDSDDEPGQNLFMAFTTSFVHLERMPALASKINSLEGMVFNTIFSAILGIAYLFALAAIFIALIIRVIFLWLALAFSPILVAGAIMGFGSGESGEVGKYLIAYLIMPLKIAAAFAVSFVMMSAMIDFSVEGGVDGGAFVFGPSLSQLGTINSGYGLIWQVATIVLFWMVAKWSLKGSGVAEDLTKYIFEGAQTLGTYTAQIATIERPIFTVGTDAKEANVSLGNILKTPDDLMTNLNNSRVKGQQAWRSFLGNEPSEFEKDLVDKNFTGLKDFVSYAMTAKSRAELDGSSQTAISKLTEVLSTTTNAELKNDIKAEISNIKAGGSVAASLDKILKGRTAFQPAGYNEGGFVLGSAYGKSATNSSDSKKDDTGVNEIKTKGDYFENSSGEQINKNDVKDEKNTAKTFFNGSMVGTQEVASLADLNSISVLQAIDKFVSTFKVKSVYGVENTKAEKVNGSNNLGIVYDSTKKDNAGKYQEMILIDRQTGIPLDFSNLGGGNNGAVNTENVTNIYNKINSADDLTNLGITSDIEKNNLLEQLKNIEGFDSNNIQN